MSTDKQSNKTNNKIRKLNRGKRDISNKKKIVESSSDESEYYTDDEMDVHEYRKYLKNIFPSKHLNNKINAGERLQQKRIFKNNDKEKKDNSASINKKVHNSKCIKKRSRKTIILSEDDDDSESEDDSDYESEDDSDYESEDDSDYETLDDDDSETDDSDDDSDYDSEDDNCGTKIKSPKKKSKAKGEYNIIFTVKNTKKTPDDTLDESDISSSESSVTENEDDPISSSSEDELVSDLSSKRKRKHNKSNNSETSNDDDSLYENDKVLMELNELVKKNPDNKKNFEKCIKMYKENFKNEKKKSESKIKKGKDRNSRILKRILKDKNVTNDFDFYQKMDLVRQNKIIKEVREINKESRVEKPYRLTLLESDIPVIFKSAAMKKINSLRHMEPGSGEYYKIKNWVDTFMRIPFGEYKTLPVSINDGIDKCHEFMSESQKILNSAVYGLSDAKMQIMQMLGQLVTNPNSIGSAIAIHGPPGTGKTSLVKEGISKILNRPFAFIALGGATDSSFLEGHGYTYEGSIWGKIVQILIDSKCMNPVIYFDELDKISDTPKGEEIAGILTHLTDTTQNSQFHDKYFCDIDFDLSKCLFIFSYNDESKVNPILKDRMYRIQTKGYNQKQKNVIANDYLLPKIREQVVFKSEDIVITDQNIKHIIEHYCNKEDGVRNLKRCLEIIHTKLNLYRLMRPDSNLFEEEMSLKVAFPFTLTNDIIDKLIKKNENSLNPSLYMLYS